MLIGYKDDENVTHTCTHTSTRTSSIDIQPSSENVTRLVLAIGKEEMSVKSMMEAGKTPEEALVREIREELSTEISVDEFLCTVEYDYPKFQLTMHCYLCSLLTEALHLNEHEAARWLGKDELGSVKWLPADAKLISHLRCLKEERRC